MRTIERTRNHDSLNDFPGARFVRARFPYAPRP